MPIFTGQDSQVHDAMQPAIFCLVLQDPRQCQFYALLGSLHAMAVSPRNIKISRCAVPGRLICSLYRFPIRKIRGVYHGKFRLDPSRDSEVYQVFLKEYGFRRAFRTDVEHTP